MVSSDHHARGNTEIQRTGSLKSPTGSSRANDLPQAVVAQRSATLRKTDSLPPYYRGGVEDLPPYTMGYAAAASPPPVQQQMSPAEMALRGIPVRNATPTHQQHYQYPSPQLNVVTSTTGGIRPGVPPPGPPSSGTPSPSSSALDSSRSSLPPAPYIPQDQSTPTGIMGRASPAQPLPQKNSPDLPPPPAWQQQPAGITENGQIPPPATSPPSAIDQNSSLPSPPSFLPPPPLAFGSGSPGSETEGNAAAAAFSYGGVQVGLPPALMSQLTGGGDTNSDTSSTVTRQEDGGSVVSGMNDGQQPMIRDTRCDLLSAIREGLFTGYISRCLFAFVLAKCQQYMLLHCHLLAKATIIIVNSH